MSGASAAAARGNNTAALWILAVNSMMAFAVGGAFGPVQELVKRDLGFSDLQVGQLAGLAVALPVALLAMPLGRLVDRANRVHILIAMGLAWTLGTALCAVASSFELLFFARMLVGAGAMCSLPVVISIAADLSAIERRGHAMLILGLGKIVGAAAAFLLGAALVSALVEGKGPAFLGGAAHWRVVLGSFAALSGLLLLPLLLLREPQRHELGEAAGAPLWPAMQAIWRRRALLFPLFLGQIAVTMADYAANVWASPVLMRDYGQKLEQFGPWVGGIVLFSGIFGTVLGGLSVDWGIKGKVKGGMLGGAALFAAISVPTALYPIMPDTVGFGWMLSVFLTSGAIAGMVTSTALSVLVPNDIRGVCIGALIVAAAIIGIGAAPALVTFVSSLMGGESQLRYALAAVGFVTSLLSAIGFILAMRHAVVPESAKQG